MLPKQILAFLLAIALLPILSVQAQRGMRYPVPVRAKHPEFKLPNVDDGKAISLSDYRGKKVLLVHFASW